MQAKLTKLAFFYYLFIPLLKTLQKKKTMIEQENPVFVH